MAKDKDSEEKLASPLLDRGADGCQMDSEGRKQRDEGSAVVPDGPTPIFQSVTAPLDDHLPGGGVDIAKVSHSTPFHGFGSLPDDCNGVLSNDLWSDRGGKKEQALQSGLRGLVGSNLKAAYPLIFSMLD